jgi:ribosome-associated protein
MAKTDSPQRGRRDRRRAEPRRGKKTSAKLPRYVELAVRAAEDKQAKDITVMDLRNAQGFTDFFVICSGTNSRQIRAIADGITDALAADGSKPNHIEGYDRSDWVLVDYFDFIVHVFSAETRAFYGLERLWGEADRVDVPSTP